MTQPAAVGTDSHGWRSQPRNDTDGGFLVCSYWSRNDTACGCVGGSRIALTGIELGFWGIMVWGWGNASGSR